MESLESSIGILSSPWRARVRSLLVGDRFIPENGKWPEFFDSMAFVTKFSTGCIGCELAFLEPFEGPKLYEPAATCEISIPEGCNNFATFTWIGFRHARVLQARPLKVAIEEKSAIWNISGCERSLPLNFGHLCAGAFGGWDRAIRWTANQKVIYAPRSFAVESDFFTLTTWCKANQATIFQGPISPEVPKDDINIGVSAPIQDASWFNLCNSPVNLIFSASPPCQTWSQGGKHSGLEAENGMTFMQVIYSTKWVRPLACLVECSDTVPAHKHYPIIVKSFEFIGYKQCWSQVVPLHELTGMKRSRWLSVFVRNDVQIFNSVGCFKLSDPFHKTWNDPTYDFFLPNDVVDQLLLTEELKLIYGNPQFLPGAKRSSFGPSPPVDFILRSRCVASEDFLPTLCASYASQHEIDSKHIASKGIFASLCIKDGKFAFLDPARFAALLGVTSDQEIFLPRNICDAFHQLGNSMSVVHSILGISIALSILGFSKQPIMHFVLKCWENRITASNTVAICDENFVCISPCDRAEDVITKGIGKCEPQDDSITITIKDSSFYVDKHETFVEFCNRIGLEQPHDQNIVVSNEGSPIELESELSIWCGSSMCCSKGNCKLFDFHIGILPIEPTIPWNPHDCDNDSFDEIDPIDLQKAAIAAEIQCSKDEDHPTEQIAVFSTIAAGKAQDHQQKVSAMPSQTTSFDGNSGHPFFVSMQVPINLDYDQTCKRIAQSIGCHESRIVWYETQHFRQPRHQRVLIASEKIHDNHEGKLVIVHCEEENPFVCRVPNPILPMQIPGCERAVNVVHNGKVVSPQTIVSVEHGDDFQGSGCLKRLKTSHVGSEPLSFQQRVNLLKVEGNKLGTDEYAVLQRIANQSLTNLQCCDVWDISKGIPCDLTNRIQTFTKSDNPGIVLACPVLSKGHWSSFEITKTSSGIRITFCNIDDDTLKVVQNQLISKFSNILVVANCQSIVIPAIHGYCGWAILYNWFTRFGISCGSSSVESLSATTFAAIHNSVISNDSFGNVSSFALQGRLACFRNFSSTCHVFHEIRFGATQTDQNTPDVAMSDGQAAKSSDPWLKYDPWQKGQKQCKWEDLTLPKDHPIHDKSHNRLQQIHRLQLNPNVGGVAFCTKSSVNDILAKKPKHPFAIILPASDKLHFDESLKLKVIPARELVVEDGATGMTYKRQVVVAFQGDDIAFELPKPSYKGTLTEKSEIVLEAHSTLMTKETANLFREKPHEAIRSKVIDQFPTKATEHFNIYSVKKLPDPNDNEKFRVQAMCKVDRSHRPSFLEASGAGDIIARDFIPKGEQISDITVIPRFWSIDRSGKSEALRSAGSTEGFAGIIATRRGLAIRAWASKVGQLRKVLMSQDERITKENIDVVPTITYESTGWPTSASPNEIIHAIVHSCGTPPIPTRCYRALGVVTWTLGFAVEPKITKFSVSFNGTTYEILLTKPVEKSKQSKGFKQSSKGISKGGRPQKEPSIQVPDETNDRLLNLETKFAAMERRQDSLETKLQNGFEGVQDQLRQVLNAVQPRSSSPGHTGYTPPPKIPKSS